VAKNTKRKQRLGKNNEYKFFAGSYNDSVKQLSGGTPGSQGKYE
jgi:hypothetical protein